MKWFLPFVFMSYSMSSQSIPSLVKLGRVSYHCLKLNNCNRSNFLYNCPYHIFQMQCSLGFRWHAALCLIQLQTFFTELSVKYAESKHHGSKAELTDNWVFWLLIQQSHSHWLRGVHPTECCERKAHGQQQNLSHAEVWSHRNSFYF